MNRIPKIIHYCWFGHGPLPELAIKCIASWKALLPDYEIMLWNEDNFDINLFSYSKEAYTAKKYAFVSDVARLYALVTYGGVYMDTDVEVLKPLDRFLADMAFSGFEDEKQIPTGIMACEKGFPLFQKLLDSYADRHFILPDGSFHMVTNVELITQECKKHGFVGNNTQQTVAGFTLYPKTFFCPLNHYNNRSTISENTYTIHHFNASWLPEEERKRRKTLRYRITSSLYIGARTVVRRILGDRLTEHMMQRFRR